MARCKKFPRISTVNVPASPDTVELVLTRATVAFLVRPRTAIGVSIALTESPGNTFSLGAAETYAEENLMLDEDLVLLVSAASAVVLEVWAWEG